MGILTAVGGAQAAQLFKDNVTAWHLGISEGDSAWDALQDGAPDPAASMTALEDHAGHLVATASYVEKDAGGSIVTPDGQKWSTTGTPTQYLYIAGNYDYADFSTAVVRELGIYIDGEADTGHESQNFLPPADLADLGSLIHVTRIDPVTRSSGAQGTLFVVLAFENS